MRNLIRLKNRAGLACALVLLGAAPLASAGTYSVVSVDGNPSGAPGTGTDGGYVEFSSSNPLDVLYGFDDLLQAPVNGVNSASASPQVLGQWKWKVQWVGATPTEAHPYQVAATVQLKGSALVDATASVYTAGYTATAYGSITDDYFSVPNTQASTSTVGGAGQSHAMNGTGAQSYNAVAGTGVFTQVPGSSNTWEAYVDGSVGSGGSLGASGNETIDSYFKGQPIYHINATAGVHGYLGVACRLTFVDGQRVQSDL